MLFDLNYETRFEILSSFSVYVTPFFLKLSNFQFLIPIVILKFQMASAVNLLISKFSMSDSES